MRDGLQNVSLFMPTAEKLAWLEAEAGMPELQSAKNASNACWSTGIV
jgi:hypothetical protein